MVDKSAAYDFFQADLVQPIELVISCFHTLPKNSLLCPINWGVYVSIETSSNEYSAPMAIEKKIKNLGAPFGATS